VNVTYVVKYIETIFDTKLVSRVQMVRIMKWMFYYR